MAFEREEGAAVAPSYMNDLAYACDLKREFASGFYVRTFGEYDLGATWLQCEIAAPPARGRRRCGETCRGG